MHFVSAISSCRLRERELSPLATAILNSSPNALVGMVMLQQQYQVKEFIQFTAGKMKRETEGRGREPRAKSSCYRCLVAWC